MNALRSLHIRFVILTVLATSILEVLVFLPRLAQERFAWLREHLYNSDTALAFAAASSALNAPLPSNLLLRLSDVERIRQHRADGSVTNFAAPGPELFNERVDLRKETRLQGVVRAVKALFQTGDGRLLVIGNSPRQPETSIEVIVPAAHLRTTLLQFAISHVTEWLLSAAVMGVLLYVGLILLLVRKLRVIPQSCPEWAEAQTDTRMTLWRDARLAALGTAVRKVNHDVRGILSSAMLAADRLSLHSDPAVQRSSQIIVSAIERTSELMRRTLDFAREGPAPLVFSNLQMHELVAELAKATPGFNVTSDVATNLIVKADRLALLRVLSNLASNAQQAGATRLTISAENSPVEIAILVADDGPGLPKAMQDRPFSASSADFATTSDSASSTLRDKRLDLAIVRDLMRAHGGDALLERTGPAGTVFRLVLPAAATEES